MKNRWMKYGIIMLAIGLVLAGCASKDGTPGDEASKGEISSQGNVGASQNTESNAPSEEEPYILEFTAKTVDGETFTAERLGDSALTMINVWGTFCSPCLNEMPDLGEIAASYDPEVFQMWGIISDVMEDASEKEIENAKTLIEETKANYPHLLLNEALYGNLVGASEYVPTTYFFNQNAELLGYVVGAKSKTEWQSIIEQLLTDL